MSNARTGFWSALGAVAGGAAGAYAGRYVAIHRPRITYTGEAKHRRSKGQHIEDAMVVGGGVGATLGAFIVGTVAAEEAPPPAPRLQR